MQCDHPSCLDGKPHLVDANTSIPDLNSANHRQRPGSGDVFMNRGSLVKQVAAILSPQAVLLTNQLNIQSAENPVYKINSLEEGHSHITVSKGTILY